MKGKIGTEGWLYIERNGEMKKQMCPFVNTGIFALAPGCGDWCPHFDEPFRLKNGTMNVQLALCHGTCLKFTELADEREKSKLSSIALPVSPHRGPSQ